MGQHRGKQRKRRDILTVAPLNAGPVGCGYCRSGDQAGSEAKFGVGIVCSLRPVRSIE